jgi:beta-phosphoglucomutase-like phosphatase (HAD superfamily)
VASSSPRVLIDAVLDAAGLRSLFAATQSADSMVRGKPAPDIYLAVAAALGVPADRCAAVEDSSNGLRSAANAGMHVIAVPRPHYPPDDDALATAELVLTDLTSLTPDALAGLG